MSVIVEFVVTEWVQEERFPGGCVSKHLQQQVVGEIRPLAALRGNYSQNKHNTQWLE